MTTADDRLRNLKRATEIRSEQCAVRRRIHAGELTIREAVELEHVDRVRVGVLLRSQRNVGPAMVSRALRVAGASDHRRWCELTDRQQQLLLDVAEFWADGHYHLPPALKFGDQGRMELAG